MWRSGSTYLASQFARSARYMLFYEPLHEGVGRKPSKARVCDRSRERNLRHPEIEGGYFGAYEQVDPLTGHPLTDCFAPEASLRTVYGRPSRATIDYLRALDRCARGAAQSAFLGFCRAGTQMPMAQAKLGGRGLHLWRDPRAQFASYDWPRNDYFMAGTLLQLARSEPLADAARALAPRPLRAPLLRLASLLPDRQARSKYRIARLVSRGMTEDESYALFYLSWLASFEAGRAVSEFSFSLTQLAQDAALRSAVEAHYGVGFEDLRETPAAPPQPIAYDRIEASVSGRFGVLAGLSSASPI